MYFQLVIELRYITIEYTGVQVVSQKRGIRLSDFKVRPILLSDFTFYLIINYELTLHFTYDKTLESR